MRTISYHLSRLKFVSRNIFIGAGVKVTLPLLILAMISTHFSVFACSDQVLVGQKTFKIYNRSWNISARNLDASSTTLPVLSCFPIGSEGMTHDSKENESLSWKSIYQFYGVELSESSKKPIDGLNEKGLSAALLWMEDATFPDTVVDPTPGAPSPIALSDLVSWILGNFETVEEVRQAFQFIEVWYDSANLPAPCHLVLHDAKGKSLVVEWIDKTPVFISKENGYNGTLTNGPDYATQLKNFQNFKSLTNDRTQGGLAGIPGDRTSMSRFALLAKLSEYAYVGPQNLQDYKFTFNLVVSSFGAPFCVQQQLHLMRRLDILRGEVKTGDENPIMEQTVMTLVRDHVGNSISDSKKGPVLYYRFNNSVTLQQVYVAEKTKSKTTQNTPYVVATAAKMASTAPCLATYTYNPAVNLTTTDNAIQLEAVLPQSYPARSDSDSCFLFAKNESGDILCWTGGKEWISAKNGELSPFATDSSQSEAATLKLTRKFLQKQSGLQIFAGRGASEADMFISKSYAQIFTVPALSDAQLDHYLSTLSRLRRQ